MTKKDKAWQKTRKEFLRDKENFQGYYTCSLCQKWIKYPDVDHIKKRGSHPDMINDQANLRILCRKCHTEVT